ncbi:MAG: ABC-three component system middle component 1 [Bacteroidota bacterium]
MIIQQTRKILETHLGKTAVESLNDSLGVFRCTKSFNKIPYQVLYIDCSDSWLGKDFGEKQLEAYIEKYLLKDYYQQSGSLQWNFYYAFVSREERIKESGERKLEIESDELYSRKYVWSPADLDRWLTQVENLSKSAAGGIERDLSSIWMSDLQKNNLDIIYTAKTFEDGYRRYMAGHKATGTPPLAGKGGKPLTENPISVIRELQVYKFRKIPKGKQFSFGQVNLLTGSNGSGKTTLMEALELLLCGVVYRNRHIALSNKGADINATIDGRAKPLKLSEGSTKLYKQRDREWYNNPDQLHNRLDISFSKYNFYNTDAAYVLANKKEGRSIREAFEDIALGDGVNELETDMRKYLERFKKEEKGYAKKLTDLRKQEATEKKLVKDISANNQNPANYLASVVKDALVAKWVLPKTRQELAFKKNLTIASTLLASIVQELKWSTITTRTELGKFIEKYTDALGEISKHDLAIKKSEQAEEKNAESLEKETEVSGLLTKLSAYYKLTRVAELPGLAKRIKDKRSEINRLIALKTIYDKITLEDLKPFDSSVNLQNQDSILNQRLRTAEKAVRDLSARQESLMRALTQLDQVIKEIKSKGLEFAGLNPGATECPLCQAPHEQGELVAQIKRSKKSIRSSGQIDALDAEIKIKKSEVKAINAQKKIIEQLKQAFDLMYESDTYTRGPLFTWNTAGKRIALLDEHIFSLDEMQNLATSFELAGMDEDEFNELTASLAEYGLVIRKAANLRAMQELTDAAIKKLKLERPAIAESIKQARNKKVTILTELGLTVSSAGQVVRRSVILSTAEKNCEKLYTLKEFRPGQLFSAIKSEIDAFKKMMDEYDLLTERKAENELRLKTSSEHLVKLQSDIAENNMLHGRTDAGAKAIETLLSQHNKQTYLEDFIEGNKKEILEIFRMIHTPTEFVDLRFDTDGNIELTREEGDPATLSEISTGQRSALSLSVFSALNRKLKNGPNLLMFDDPVANVDDLNVLSYFDYLREVAAKGSRQIFFATANENLAFLFAQKFAFLGDEFKTIPLGKNAAKKILKEAEAAAEEKEEEEESEEESEEETDE